MGKLPGQTYYKYGEITHGEKADYQVSHDPLYVIMEKIEGHPIMKPIRLQNVNNKYNLFDNRVLQKMGNGCGELLEYPVTIAGIVYKHLKKKFNLLLAARRTLIIHTLANQQGDIIEVSFFFWNHPAWQAIPPGTFYAIEQEIKKKIKLVNPKRFNEDHIYTITHISFSWNKEELFREEKETKQFNKDIFFDEQKRKKHTIQRDSITK